MTAPYYQDEHVTLYHGDALDLHHLWCPADILVTDPPYGIAWNRPATKSGAAWHNPGIQGDTDTTARDTALHHWGTTKPALVFGDLRHPPPNWRRALVFEKPSVTASGMFGAQLPWRKNWEPIYVLGTAWPATPATRSAVITTTELSAGGYSGYTTRTGHPHTKPLDVMHHLIQACPPGVIADPFAGSGSTLIAARDLGRHAIGVEIDERYCETAARRLAQTILELT